MLVNNSVFINFWLFISARWKYNPLELVRRQFLAVDSCTGLSRSRRSYAKFNWKIALRFEFQECSAPLTYWLIESTSLAITFSLFIGFGFASTSLFAEFLKFIVFRVWFSKWSGQNAFYLFPRYRGEFGWFRRNEQPFTQSSQIIFSPSLKRISLS